MHGCCVRYLPPIPSNSLHGIRQESSSFSSHCHRFSRRVRERPPILPTINGEGFFPKNICFLIFSQAVISTSHRNSASPQNAEKKSGERSPPLFRKPPVSQVLFPSKKKREGSGGERPRVEQPSPSMPPPRGDLTWQRAYQPSTRTPRPALNEGTTRTKRTVEPPLPLDFHQKKPRPAARQVPACLSRKAYL
jgi:hypothetical protein